MLSSVILIFMGFPFLPPPDNTIIHNVYINVKHYFQKFRKISKHFRCRWHTINKWGAKCSPLLVFYLEILFPLGFLSKLRKPLVLLAFAFVWHSRGQRFDPAYLHHRNRLKSLIINGFGGFSFFNYFLKFSNIFSYFPFGFPSMDSKLSVILRSDSTSVWV